MPSRRATKKPAPVAVPDEPVAASEATLRVCEIEPSADVLPFRRWLFGLRDVVARNRVIMRIDRILTGGNFGDHRERIEGAISELRIDYGQGYRVYYVRHGDLIVIFVGGGTKDGQQADIEAVAKLWEQVKNDVERYTRDFIP